MNTLVLGVVVLLSACGAGVQAAVAKRADAGYLQNGGRSVASHTGNVTLVPLTAPGLELVMALKQEGANLSLVGDPRFDANTLSPPMRLWYDRVWSVIQSPNENPDPDRLAATGDLYSLGRGLSDYITALLSALRATGDLKFLDEADRLLEIARGKLADTNKDGFLNWRWLHKESVPAFYGDDRHVMDEIMTHSMVAYAAYAFQANAQFKPVYAQRAAFWTDYLVNHFLKKWQTREHSTEAIALRKELTHPFANTMRMALCLYRLTGKRAYLDRANANAQILYGMMQTRPNAPEAFFWDHAVPPHKPLGVQNAGYGHYTQDVFVDMAMEGFGKWASDAYMAHYASTWRDRVWNNRTASMADLLDGTGEWRKGFLMYSSAALARWDKTGAIAALAESHYSSKPPKTYMRMHLAAHMLQALSTRSAPPPDVPGKP